ncbi:MAG: MoaD/ThiS family protein [Candidatus Bathyarchaeia archaeon]|jgi:MoaD family protein
MTISLKFLGTLRHISNTSKLALSVNGALSVKELLSRLVEEIPALKQSLSPQQLEDLQSSTLILVNGKEISVLDGLATNLNDGDEVVFVPVVHGG